MDSEKVSRRIERIASLLMVAFGIAGFLAVPYMVQTWAMSLPGMTSSSLSPTFFPRVAMLAVAATALAVIATEKSRKEPLPIVALVREDWQRFAIATASIIGYVALMGLLGFIVSSTLFLIIMALTAGYRRFEILLPTAVLFPIATYCLFRWGLKVLLPSGIIL